ncbi:hypothetical protein B0T26DRAFT_636688 [Lasiosphaeria miniovina]|uniref:RING-type domain-containing protein n=1 Tax=Lasiosphaeria miniovina TaxID=1954250 RepID=A0AA40B464_9PEZI|nr:uncharacterized protein B0T26DRAFT_636688 [Lasiosphaeria miniovina]KAK0727376.1 hypothetical protein B0T26DRAFT_636688 [Lasiosphaeria miniovina]
MKQKARYYSGKKDSAIEKQSAKAEVEAICPICQESIGTRNAEGIVEGWSILPCGHRFGSYCIKHYLNVVAEDRPSCPVCRQIAYHICGHPVLPALLRPNSSEGERIVEVSELLIQELQSSDCAYCQLGRASRRRSRKPASKWKAAVGLLRYLKLRPSQLLGRHRALAGPQTQQGPWIDPFPKPRDPEWERWWVTQEPSGA